ncbi:hypothetical protein [Chitinimonas lacunae]|uniref:Uncharacterized protein n=1 Tax=Chitinimonas lacunae TaxID=1963018 RepID=A0ABV8MMU7_9NEIS
MRGVDLHIHEWLNDYRMPREQPAAPTLGADLDRLAPRVAALLAERLGELLGEAEAVVLLPDIAVDLTLDIASPPERLAAHWSDQLALALGRAIYDPGSGAVHYASQAAYRAAFLGDLLQDRAWHSWRYRRFDGLRILPAAAAARTLLVEDTALGLATLALLDDAVWPAFAALLTPREALRILLAWHAAPPEASAGTPGRSDPPGHPLRSLTGPLAALRHVALWQRQAPTADLATACWLAALRSLPANISPAELERLVRTNDLRRLFAGSGPAAHAPPADPDWLSLLASAPLPARLAATALAVVERQEAAASAATLSVPDLLDAPFGGLVWLLPSLQSLLTPTLLAGLPAPAGCSSLDALALLTLAVATGPQADAVWRDPFWRTFFRLPPRFDQVALAAWLAKAEPAALMTALANALQHQARGEAVRLRYPLQRVRRDRLIDSATGGWLGAVATEQPVSWRSRLALTRQSRRDERLLSQAGPLAALPPGWHEPVLLLAQAALRHTAYRIPGHARSSLPYLFARLFGVSGQAELCAPCQWRLRLVRPPLHVLLSLSGMTRLRLQWPGQPSPTLTLSCSG